MQATSIVLTSQTGLEESWKNTATFDLEDDEEEEGSVVSSMMIFKILASSGFFIESTNCS